jgi:hypothetical protein
MRSLGGAWGARHWLLLASIALLAVSGSHGQEPEPEPEPGPGPQPDPEPEPGPGPGPGPGPQPDPEPEPGPGPGPGPGPQPEPEPEPGPGPGPQPEPEPEPGPGPGPPPDPDPDPPAPPPPADSAATVWAVSGAVAGGLGLVAGCAALVTSQMRRGGGGGAGSHSWEKEGADESLSKRPRLRGKLPRKSKKRAGYERIKDESHPAFDHDISSRPSTLGKGGALSLGPTVIVEPPSKPSKGSKAKPKPKLHRGGSRSGQAAEAADGAPRVEGRRQWGKKGGKDSNTQRAAADRP